MKHKYTFGARYRLLLSGTALVCLASVAAAQTIDTTGAWDGTSFISSWGDTNTATYGQTITAPAGATSLNDVTFYLYQSSGIQSQYQAFVYEWDPVNSVIVGPALGTSAVMTAPAGAVFTPTTVDFGAVPITPGTQYVVFLTTSAIPGQGSAGYRWGAVSDAAYADGRFVYSNNADDFSDLSTSGWSQLSQDLAFIINLLAQLQGAQTPNEQAIEGALNNSFSDPAIFAALAALTTEQRQAAYNQLSGELFADGPAMAAQSAQDFLQFLLGGNAAFAPLGASPTAYGDESSMANLPAGTALAQMAGANTLPVPDRPEFALLAGAYGNSTEIDGDGNGARWNSVSGGFAGGAEARLDRMFPGMNVVVGAAGGFSHVEGTVNRGQTVDVDSYNVGIYGRAGASMTEPGFGIKVGFAYSHQEYDTRRDIAFAGLTARSNYDGDAFSGSGEARYGFAIAGGPMSALTVAPTIGADGSVAEHGGFAETGAGALNLTSGGEEFDSVNVRAGVRIASAFAAGSAIVVPEVGLFYERAFGDVTPSATLTLTGSNTAFAVKGPNEGRDRARLNGGFTALITDRVSIQFSGDGVFSGDRTDFSGSGRVKVHF